MSLNKATGNMYEFVTHTWNPIRGKCPHECSYCYVTAMAKRYKVRREPLHLEEKELKTNLGKEKYIFVGSSTDMFAVGIKDEWISAVLERCCKYNENKYLFQSKDTFRMYQFIDQFPKDSMICTTIETDFHCGEIMGNTPSPKQRAEYLSIFKNKMITIEPILEFSHYQMCDIIQIADPQQVNIGADSGNNHLPEPSKDQIEKLIAELSTFTKVVQKKNLKRLLK